MPILAAADYWKLRALQRDLEVTTANAQRAIQTAQAVLDQVLRDLSIDPAVPYQMNDGTFELVDQRPKAPPSAPPPPLKRVKG